MPVLNPYLNFRGNTEEVFNFYRSVFGGEFATVMRFKDMPPQNKQPEGENNKILHIALPVGKGSMLMGSDVPEAYPAPATGTNFAISVSADSEEQAGQLFNGLSNGGDVTMPLGKAFWGSLFGMCTDKFGVQWMISYDYNRPQ
jgi:PhnB protein